MFVITCTFIPLPHSGMVLPFVGRSCQIKGICGKYLIAIYSPAVISAAMIENARIEFSDKDKEKLKSITLESNSFLIFYELKDLQ